MRVKLLISFLLVAVFLKSQDLSELRNAKEITYFGLDFTQAKMIGELGSDFKNPQSIVTHYFRTWNNLVVKEKVRYDIEWAFRWKKEVLYSIDSAISYSQQVDSNTLVTRKINEINSEQVSQIVSAYANSSKDGIGMLFIVVNFNKLERHANYILAFFNINDGSLLLSKHLSGRASGMGFRNYWSNCLKHALEDIHRHFPKWVREPKKKKQKRK